MKPFKFFRDFDKSICPLSGIVYGWNIYEQKVMNIYKFCYDADVEFIGFYQTFIENGQEKILTIKQHIMGRVCSHIIYEIWDGRRSIYTLRISNEDLISIQQYENV